MNDVLNLEGNGVRKTGGGHVEGGFQDLNENPGYGQHEQNIAGGDFYDKQVEGIANSNGGFMDDVDGAKEDRPIYDYLVGMFKTE